MTIKPFKSEAVVGGRRTGEAFLPVSPVQFTIPTPPSVNQAYKNVPGRGRVKTKSYSDWIYVAVQSIRSQKIRPVHGYHIPVIGIERSSLSADVDNRLKLTLDALGKAKVIDDDRYTTAIAIAWLPMANALTHIQIHPVGKLALEFHPSSDGATGAWITAPQLENGDHDGLIAV